MQPFQTPQEDALGLGAHLLRDVGVIHAVRVFLFDGQDDLAAKEPLAAVIERFQ